MLVENKESKEIVSRIFNSNYDYLAKICYPLFKGTPITYFDYTRYYDNGEATGFSCNPDLCIGHVNGYMLPTFEEFQLFSYFQQEACFLSTSISLPPGLEDVSQEKYEKNIACSTDLGIYHRLYLVKRYQGYYVTSGFGIRNDNKSIINFYLNALPNLKKFLKYFDFQSREYFDNESINSRFLLPGYHNKLIVDDLGFEFPLANLNEFEKNISEDVLGITLREKECLSLIAQGYTMKSIAIKLGISHRTVEQHLRNIKEKKCLNTKSQLVELWHKYFNHQ